jgi:replicative DNA helicase
MCDTPRNLASERVILGALIEEESILSAAVGAGLDIEDFFLSDHRRIFAAMLELRENNSPVDYITVAEQLGNRQADVVLLASLIDGVVIDRSHVLYHIGIVRKKSRLRRLQQLAEWMLQSANEISADPDALTEVALEKLGAVAEVRV